MSRPTSFTKEEVAKHSSANDLWIIVDSVVYDLTKFSLVHPGGRSILLEHDTAGKDATEAFFSLHRQEVLHKPQYSRFAIGLVEGGTVILGPHGQADLSEVPYGEPMGIQYHSPYYKESHKEFQLAMRKFVREVVYPDAQVREESGKPPSQSVLTAMAEMNIIGMRLGPGKHLAGRILMGGIVKPEEYDLFHECIIWQELAKTHARGYNDGLGAGTSIGLPPVLNFGTETLKNAIVEDILSGKKSICLAVSEAFAGSDVAGIRCLARPVENGWIVNGTNGLQTELLLTISLSHAGRTMERLSQLVLPRQKGVSTRLIHTSYSPSAGTAFVEFNNVFVPNENQLGAGRDGLHVILGNFNHERFVVIAWSIGCQRAIVEECLRYITQRTVFGKPLSSQSVIRAKLAAMISRTESCQSWLESIIFQMQNMDYNQQASHLAGPIALLKMQTTRFAQDTARDAVQIFGGRGLTKSGMGKFIEHFHRTLLIDTIGGGAEDILADLGVRQALRKMPKSARL